MEISRRPDFRGSWLYYLLLVGIMVGVLVALNIGLRGGRLDGAGVGHLPAARHLTPALTSLMVVLFGAGAVGVVLALRFFDVHAAGLRLSPRPAIQPQILLICFLVYLISFLILDVVAGLIATLAGFRMNTGSGAAIFLALQGLSRLGALVLGLSALRSLTALSGEDPREIGWRMPPLADVLKWGVGGYCAALPFMGAMLAVSGVLSKTVFRHVPTPIHPIVPMLLAGRASFVVALVLAAIIAPIVEETFFRGMFYNALRARMGVWSAALLSAAVFAIVHPTLPEGFLPILALGCVLAILREKTGSLVPSMICHGLNNAVAIVIAKMLF